MMKTGQISIENPNISVVLQQVKRAKLVSFIIVAVGFIVGCLTATHYLQNHVLFGLNRLALLKSEYYQTDFYKNNPAAAGSNPFDIETTMARLYEHFPDDNIHDGENNIFQMWKKRPEDCEYGEFPDDSYKRWIDLNPGYNYTFYTNDETKQIFKRVFKSTVPEVYEAFRLLPLIILQSDFARYLLVFLEGGTYADIDVSPYKPVANWIDQKLDVDINVVISVEADLNFINWANMMPRRLEFLQWTFKSRRRNPFFARLIAKIVKVTFEAQLENRLVAYSDQFVGVDPCRSVNVMDWTGPGIFTDTVFESLNAKKGIEIVETNINRWNAHEDLHGPQLMPGEIISWKLFTGLESPIVAGDILVLPSWGFNAYEDCESLCYVNHHFAGSWKHPD